MLNVSMSLCGGLRAAAALDVGQHLVIEDQSLFAVIECVNRARFDQAAEGGFTDQITFFLQPLIDVVD